MKKSAFLAAAMLLALAGCATATPYQPAEPDGNGFRNQQIEANRYRISFSGNFITLKETVETYLLYRAAEITLETGGDYFVLVESDTERVQIRGGGGYSSYYGFGHHGGHGYGGFGLGHGYGYGYGYGYGSGLGPLDKFEVVATILVFPGNKPTENEKAHDARDVIKRLKGLIMRPEDLQS